jgi:hypothetical protein
MGNYTKPQPYYAFTFRNYADFEHFSHYIENDRRERQLNYQRWRGYENNERYDNIDYVTKKRPRVYPDSYMYTLVDIVKEDGKEDLELDFRTEIVY